jgi:hypothetical protein
MRSLIESQDRVEFSNQSSNEDLIEIMSNELLNQSESRRESIYDCDISEGSRLQIPSTNAHYSL